MIPSMGNDVMQERVRPVIFWFIIFISLMLFQTSYMHLGTITASASLLFTIVAAFLGNTVSVGHVKLSSETVLLIAFLVLTSINTLVNGIPGSFVKFLGLCVLWIVFASFCPPLNEKEARWTLWAFMIASVAYSLLIITVGSRVEDVSYLIHSRIRLFGTTLDPNFVGLPLIVGATLLLDRIFNAKKRALLVCMYSIVVVAIVYTASRGNFVSLMISNGLLALYFISLKKQSAGRAIFLSILLMILLLLLFWFISTRLSSRWVRMTSLGIGEDNGRFECWKASLDLWKKNLMLGNGLGGVFRLCNFATHCTYIQLLSETGILGFILFILFLLKNLKRAFRYSSALGCAFLGCLVHITFLDSLDNRCLWVVLCMIVLLSKSESPMMVQEYEDIG